MSVLEIIVIALGGIFFVGAYIFIAFAAWVGTHCICDAFFENRDSKTSSLHDEHQKGDAA